MGYEVQLSEKIMMYFMIIERLTAWHDGFDSASPEHKAFESEISYYLNQIRIEVEKHETPNP